MLSGRRVTTSHAIPLAKHHTRRVVGMLESGHKSALHIKVVGNTVNATLVARVGSKAIMVIASDFSGEPPRP